MMFEGVSPRRASSRPPSRSREEDSAELSRTFGRLVHEIKTPLAALRALAQGLGYEPAVMADPAAREVAGAYAARMVSEVDRLVRMVDEFKSLSKPARVASSSIDLQAVVGRIAGGSLAQRARERGIRFRVAALDEARVAIEPDQIVQVLTNLVENALRATPTGGVVAVAVERRHDVARLLVEDTGAGLTDEALCALLAGEPPPGASGTGIGLLVVRAIAQSAGGRLLFERRSPSGTRAIVELPAHG